MNIQRLLAAFLTTTTLSLAAYAATNDAKIVEKSDQTCVISNGIANHSVGNFPRKGNPHRIREQDIEFCFTSDPVKGAAPRIVPTIGIAENGIIIRPGTADYYDASSPRGHSRDPASGWNLDGMGPDNTLGLDQNNAHVDHNGIYHYHGVPEALVAISDDTRIGWAADGFEIHYVGQNAQPSFMLKTGTRPSAPGGIYDGSFNEDFEYIKGYGNLDQCNGAMLNGEYVYFATDAYPFFPRCLYGTEITRFR